MERFHLLEGCGRLIYLCPGESRLTV
jgi:hypothetical protein